MKEDHSIRWDLVILYIRRELPDDKKEEWKEFLKNEPAYQVHVDEMKRLVKELPLSPRFTPEELKNKYATFVSRCHPSPRLIHRKIFVYLSGVAAVLLLCFVGLQWWNFTRMEDVVISSVDDLAICGSMKAELILASGECLQLDKMSCKRLKYAKVDSSGLVYDDQESPGNEMEYNVLRVPKGGVFQLTLSDNTVVFLNSESELKYPVSFTGVQRMVFLKGEGYFEVSQNGIPFVIHTMRQHVEVLGTEFNVSSYGGDAEDEVVLVSGKVRLNYEDKATYILNPGEKASLSKDSIGYRVNRVDTRFYTGWKEGIFYFNRMSLGKIMEQLSRWYDVEICFAEKILEQLHFSGAIEKDRPLSDALDMIKATTSVEFKIQNKTIVVQKK